MLAHNQLAERSPGPMAGHRSASWRYAGPTLAVACVVVSGVGFWLAVGPGERPLAGLMDDNVLNNVINGLSLGALAGVLTRLRPHNRLGWLILAIAWGNAMAVIGEGWALTALRYDLPGLTLFAWLGSWPWAPALLLGPAMVALLYPSGRTTSRFAHRLAVTSVVAAGTVAACLMLLDATYDGVVPGRVLGDNPISHGRMQVPLAVLAGLGAAAGLVVAVLAWGHTLRRMWRAESPEREQLAWLVAMVAPLLVAAPLNVPALMFALQVVSPIGLVIGIVRHQLFNIKLVLRSGLVYGVLTAMAVAVYFGLVALITTLTPRGTVPSLFAVAAVGLVIVPAHRTLQTFFGRLVYGDRADPLRALARLTEGLRVVDTDDATGMRPMLEGIAAALRSPYVLLAGAGGQMICVVGVDRGHPLHSVDLEHAGESVGRLTVAGRTPRDPLGAADRRLVAAIAGPVAAAVGASVTAGQLAESRSRVLAVRESERRRLREDLHDGLGPSLSGVALGLEAARRSVVARPERIPEILDVLRTEVDSLVAEVRGIIDDLGPGDTDLLAAVRRQIDAVTAGGDLAVELAELGDLADIPGEVAVTAQRIVGEALTNAARHAAAHTVLVSLSCRADQLVVEVADDGSGMVRRRPGGVGLDSMRQRAEAVGGVLTVSAVPDRGTLVQAVLPLRGAS